MPTLPGLAAAAITVVQLVLPARIVSSWVSYRPLRVHVGASAWTRASPRLTEPILTPVRRVIPSLRPGSGSLDVSIPVALFALSAPALLLPGA
jgi:uncharacterized protein YggT (Ycf19 family)